jgi:NADH-quinone oxidoreductase subunit H
VAFYTVGERKFLAAIQRRKGPNIVGPFGLFQPIADGIKLVLKELLIPTKINALAYFLAPVLCFFLALSN